MAKKTRVRAKMSQLDEVDRLIGDWVSADWWVLVPKPDPRMKNPRQALEDAVRHARVKLIFTKWDECQEAARSLSEEGGIDLVHIVRVKRQLNLNAMFRNGKSVTSATR